MRVDNIKKNEISFNATIKGTYFRQKGQIAEALSQPPFNKCNEVFTVSTTDVTNKAFIAIRKQYHNAKGIPQGGQPAIKGIPIEGPYSEDRDLCIMECIMKYLSENYDTIPKQTYDDVCRKLGIRRPLDEIMSTNARIAQYAKNAHMNLLNYYRLYY